jgi:hypothetical protein
MAWATGGTETRRAFAAMMDMGKIDIAKLRPHLADEGDDDFEAELRNWFDEMPDLDFFLAKASNEVTATVEVD